MSLFQISNFKFQIFPSALLHLLFLLAISLRAAASSNSIDVATIDRGRILKAADAALTLEPITITKFRAKLSEAGPNDFYSNGDYWWPNPNSTNGLPYVQRDGQTNPENFIEHRKCIAKLQDAVAALGSAYKVTGEDRYAAKAAQLLRVFFIDPGTRMNPHLKYAQAIPGVSSGRGIGIIDTLHLIEVPMAVLAMGKSPAFPADVTAGLKKWFSDYVEWMTTSKNGNDEANAGNNHAVAYWLQIAAFSQLTGDESKLAECRRRYKEVFVAKQMAEDGSFPAELKRTKPYGYSIFQLDNMATLCRLLSTPTDDLWKFELPDGRGIRKAMAFMYPYLADKSTWPRKPDVQAWEGWPAREPSLLFAGLAFGEQKYLDLWKHLPADPTDSEVRRNIAITQPLLFVADDASHAPRAPSRGSLKSSSANKPAGSLGPSDDDAKAEHSDIGLSDASPRNLPHTSHPDAQWFPDAGLGLFIHWGICSVKAMNISWPMIPGRALARTRITDPAERERILREGDYDLKGKPPSITPTQYWKMAKDFNPQKYDPDKWLKAAREAGFQYAVLTTKHHEGFALWPSAYGDLNTKNYMGGRDLVKDYVEACRLNGLKVGLYYSGPDWYFDRDYKDFLYGGGHKTNPEFPPLGPDLKPRTSKKTLEETAKHQAACAAMVNGQIEELLTRYGKIDLLWFDGKPSVGKDQRVISLERIHELQPGIVVNPRMHGQGDFITYERTLGTDTPAAGWAEFCNTWTTSWSHQEIPFRAPGYVLGQFVKCRSLHINYLLGVGPMASGEFCDGVYENMEIVANWMKINSAAVRDTEPLPAAESASVPATASGSARYLFLVPVFEKDGAYDKDLLPAKDATIKLKGVSKPVAAKLLTDSKPLDFDFTADGVTIKVPATRRTRLVDVVQLDLGTAASAKK
jgi:alpha-L-fucosidase